MKIRNGTLILPLLVTLVFSLSAQRTSAAEANLNLGSQILVVDHSGSMRGQYAWIGEAIVELNRNQSRPGNFGLMEFSKDSRTINVGEGLLGDANAFNFAVNALRTGGGAEDGYLAINTAIHKYSVQETAAPHLILITDEHRTVIDESVDVNSLSQKLAENQVPVTVIVNVRFVCADETHALGIDSNGMGVVVDKSGNIADCKIKRMVEQTSAKSITDYVDLALSTGGSAWDMLIPRKSELDSQVFAQAFAQIHGRAIDQSMQSLAVIPNVKYVPENPKVGDLVMFDASDSQSTRFNDFIRSWQWDFDSDKQMDMNGDSVAHVFNAPGEHEVSIWYTTNQAQQPVKRSFKVTVLEK